MQTSKCYGARLDVKSRIWKLTKKCMLIFDLKLEIESFSGTPDNWAIASAYSEFQLKDFAEKSRCQMLGPPLGFFCSKNGRYWAEWGREFMPAFNNGLDETTLDGRTLDFWLHKLFSWYNTSVCETWVSYLDAVVHPSNLNLTRVNFMRQNFTGKLHLAEFLWT